MRSARQRYERQNCEVGIERFEVLECIVVLERLGRKSGRPNSILSFWRIRSARRRSGARDVNDLLAVIDQRLRRLLRKYSCPSSAIRKAEPQPTHRHATKAPEELNPARHDREGSGDVFRRGEDHYSARIFRAIKNLSTGNLYCAENRRIADPGARKNAPPPLPVAGRSREGL